MKRIAIIGDGGFAREVYHHMVSDGYDSQLITFYVDSEYANGKTSFPLSNIEFNNTELLVCIGDPNIREQMVAKLPHDAKYHTFVHSSAILLAHDIIIGKGSVICAGSILTTNIKLGEHSHLNLHTTIGHDVEIDDYFTSAPGVNISGNVKIGKRVYFGTNAVCREKLAITDDITIGLNSGVVKNLFISGTYVGTPCKLI